MLIVLTTFLSFLFHVSRQSRAEVVGKEVYITHRTCGSTINLSAVETLYLDYHGSVLDYNQTGTGHYKKQACIIDVETTDVDEQICIKTEQSLLGDGCRLKFKWHEGARDFMLFGLSTYWCDMFSYSSMCLPVWRSRLILEKTSQGTSIRMQFTTKRKVPAKPIYEQPRHVNINKPFVYGLRGRLSLDFYIVLTALVFICACVAVVAVMRQMKNREIRRRILSTNIELVPLPQTQTEPNNTIHQNLPLNSNSHASMQQRISLNAHQCSGLKTENINPFQGYGNAIAMPPPYMEKPPPYHKTS